MISKSERKRLKKALGKHYSEAVLLEITAKGLTTKQGNPYTSNMVRRVFNGANHEAIEACIYIAAEKAITKKAKEQTKRKRILKSA